MRYDDPLLAKLAAQAEQQYGLPSRILDAIRLGGEKSNSDAVSPKSARGVYQFIPSTWAAYGRNRDPANPHDATDAAAKYMADLLKQYRGNVTAALAHYNGGGRSGKAVLAGQPLNSETAAYVPRALAVMQSTPEIPTSSSGPSREQVATLPTAVTAQDENDPFGLGLVGQSLTREGDSTDEPDFTSVTGDHSSDTEPDFSAGAGGNDGLESLLGLGSPEQTFISRDEPVQMNLASEQKYGGHTASDLRALFEEAFSDASLR